MSNNEIAELKEAEKQTTDDAFANFDEEPADKSSSSGTCASWTGNGAGMGIGLIVAGSYLLLGQMFGFGFPENWWALFILVPGVLKLGTAVQAFGRTGRLTGRVVEPLTGGMVLTFIGSMFLLNLNWSLFWPVMLIVVGVAGIAKGMAHA